MFTHLVFYVTTVTMSHATQRERGRKLLFCITVPRIPSLTWLWTVVGRAFDKSWRGAGGGRLISFISGPGKCISIVRKHACILQIRNGLFFHMEDPPLPECLDGSLPFFSPSGFSLSSHARQASPQSSFRHQGETSSINELSSGHSFPRDMQTHRHILVILIATLLVHPVFHPGGRECVSIGLFCT